MKVGWSGKPTFKSRKSCFPGPDTNFSGPASQSGPGHATTTRDLRAALFAVATAEERGLIASWLDHVVLCDLAVTAATARRTADGTYEVALTVRAGRNEVMPDGSEVALPLREAVVVSLAGANGEIRRVRSLLIPGENTIRVVVGAPPLSAVVDPDFTRVDANRADNVIASRRSCRARGASSPSPARARP